MISKTVTSIPVISSTPATAVVTATTTAATTIATTATTTGISEEDEEKRLNRFTSVIVAAVYIPMLVLLGCLCRYVPECYYKFCDENSNPLKVAKLIQDKYAVVNMGMPKLTKVPDILRD